MTSHSEPVAPPNEWTEYTSLRERMEQIKQITLRAEVPKPKPPLRRRFRGFVEDWEDPFGDEPR